MLGGLGTFAYTSRKSKASKSYPSFADHQGYTIEMLDTNDVLKRTEENHHYAADFTKFTFHPFDTDIWDSQDRYVRNCITQWKTDRLFPVEVDITWINDEMTLRDVWNSNISPNSDTNMNDQIWIMRKNVFDAIFTNDPKVYRNIVNFINCRDIEFKKKYTSKKQAFYIDLSPYAADRLKLEQNNSWLQLNSPAAILGDSNVKNINNKNIGKINVCIEPNKDEIEVGLNQMFDTNHDINEYKYVTSKNIDIDTKYNEFCKSMRAAQIQKEWDPRYRGEMALMPNFTIWNDKSGDKDNYSVLCNKYQICSYDQIVELMQNKNNDIQFVDIECYSVDTIDENQIKDSWWGMECIRTNHNLIKSDEGLKLVKMLKDKTHVVLMDYKCDYTDNCEHSREVATSYLFQMRKLFPYSKQKVLCALGGKDTWQKNVGQYKE